MAGGNWDIDQQLTAGQVQWPTGPLVLASGETPKWVEAWVVQRSTGASQRTVQSNFSPLPSPPKWVANGGLWIHGTFSRGPALGIALLASEQGSTRLFYWWTDMIVLRP